MMPKFLVYIIYYKINLNKEALEKFQGLSGCQPDYVNYVESNLEISLC
jgi:hypothetical protein